MRLYLKIKINNFRINGSFICHNDSLIFSYQKGNKMKINQPKIPKQLEEKEFHEILEDDYTEFHLAEVKNAVFTGDILQDMRLGQTIIKKWSIRRNRF